MPTSYPLPRTRRPAADVLAAGLAAAALSGVPSTLHALLVTRRPLDGARAAGSLALPGRHGPVAELLAAVPVHLALSLGWAAVLAAILPPRRTAAWGALAGAGIAALDLGLVGRRLPRIRALPQVPQVLDHLAYGAVVGAVLEARSR